MKKLIVWLIILLIIGVGSYLLVENYESNKLIKENQARIDLKGKTNNEVTMMNQYEYMTETPIIQKVLVKCAEEYTNECDILKCEYESAQVEENINLLKENYTVCVGD